MRAPFACQSNPQHLCIYATDDADPSPQLWSASDNENDDSPSTANSRVQALSQSAASTTSQQGSCDDSVRVVSDQLGYAMHNTTGTLGLIKIAGDLMTAASVLPTQGAAEANREAASRFMAAMRQLPSQKHTELLASCFFSDVAWYYDTLDEADFQRQLQQWNRMPYSTLSRGPFALTPEMRAFPALLCQVLAHALLFLPTRLAPDLQDAKYIPDMSFADLAVELSEAGHGIATLLGSKEMVLSKVQAGLLRASLLKSMGAVADAWHVLGGAIRDAQEMGLHKAGAYTIASLDEAEAGPPEALRQLEMRARLWLTLHLWDSHMGTVLGRPLATRLDVDVWMAIMDDFERRNARQHPGEVPWSPFALVVLGFKTAYRYLQDLQDLDTPASVSHIGSGASDRNRSSPTAADATQQRLSRLLEINAAIIDGMRRLPAWINGPDGRDSDHQHNHSTPSPVAPPWLAAAREVLYTELHFTLLALHRPSLFVSRFSRRMAYQAALQILASQARMFAMSAPREYMPFNLVFATFDGIVLLATLYLLYPDEGPDELHSALQSIQWGLARLESMKATSSLAKCSFDVVQALYEKLRKRYDPPPPPSSSHPFTSTAATSAELDFTVTSLPNVPDVPNMPSMPDVPSVPEVSIVSDMPSIPFEPFLPSTMASLPQVPFEPVLPNTLANFPPPQPLHDLLLHSSALSAEMLWAPSATVGQQQPHQQQQPQEIPVDAFWHLLNQF